MTLQEKIDMIEDIMDVDEGTLTGETVLSELEEWDSLSTLSLTVTMRNRFGVTLTTDIIKSFEKVADICAYIPD